MAIIGGEVTLSKIGDCVSKMPIGDLKNMGRLVKTYGYYGAFLTAVGVEMEENTISVNCCTLSQYNRQYTKYEPMCMIQESLFTAEVTRSR